MESLKLYTADNTWWKLLTLVRGYGKELFPTMGGLKVGQTYKRTKELIHVPGTLVDMRHPIVTNRSRNISWRFMFAEAFWILSGDRSLAGIEPYCKRYREFSDNGVILAGAYGPKIEVQLDYVLNCLRNDINSRQAVMSTWKINPRPSKDIPCTLSTQFLIRNNKLNLIHTMRSSDLWLGWPYDIFTFSMLGLLICVSLRNKYPTLELGHLFFSAGSLHYYYDVEQKVQDAYLDCIDLQPIDPSNYETPGDVLAWLCECRDSARTGELKNEFKNRGSNQGS